MVSRRKWKMLQTRTSRRELNDLPCKINYPGLVLAPEVQNITSSPLIPYLCQKASDCICHVAERPRLRPVSEHGQVFTLQRLQHEPSDHPAVEPFCSETGPVT